MASLLMIMTLWVIVSGVISLLYARREILAACREPVLRRPLLIIESDDWGPGPTDQAEALLASGDYAAAAAGIAELVELEPGELFLRSRLVLTQLLAGRADQARAALEEFLERVESAEVLENVVIAPLVDVLAGGEGPPGSGALLQLLDERRAQLEAPAGGQVRTDPPAAR